MSTESDAPIKTENPFNYTRVEYANYVDFAETHTVHQELLPFEFRSMDPVAVMTDLTEYLNSRPPTRQRLSTNAIVSELDPDNAHNVAESLETFMLIHGWWHAGRTASGTYYCNPEYVHSHGDDAITDWDARRELLTDAAQLGVLDPHHLAPMFGYTTTGETAGNTVLKAVSRIGVPWSEYRAKGRRAMARTCKTLHAWGYDHREIAAAMSRPRRTVTDWINRDAADFSPPTDPTRGFTRGN